MVMYRVGTSPSGKQNLMTVSRFGSDDALGYEYSMCGCCDGWYELSSRFSRSCRPATTKHSYMCSGMCVVCCGGGEGDGGGGVGDASSGAVGGVALAVASDEPLSNRERAVGMRYCCTTCSEPCEEEGGVATSEELGTAPAVDEGTVAGRSSSSSRSRSSECRRCCSAPGFSSGSWKHTSCDDDAIDAAPNPH